MKKILYFLFSFVIFLTGFKFLFFYAQGAVYEVVLNEIMWGKDQDGEEWIELKNITDKNIDISGWKIENAKSSNRTLEIANGIIPANGYFLICHNNSQKDYCDFYDSISLANDYKNNGKLVLKNKEGILVDQTPEPQTSKWPAGTSGNVSMLRVFLNNQPTNSWISGDPPTPQGSGILLVASAGDSIISITGKYIIFDGSRSTGNIQKYIWNFGDGRTAEGKIVTYQYRFPGKYIVSLTISDGRKTAVDSIEVIIYSNSIFISEFSPAERWIEIVNESNYTQNISGWGISNKKEKIIFKFPENSFIASKSFILLSFDVLGFSLSKDGGSLFLFYPSGDIHQQIDYEKAGNLAIARNNNAYFYTTTKTPGAANILRDEGTISNQGRASSTTSVLSAPLKSSLGESKVGNLADKSKIKTTPEKNKENILNKNLMANIKSSKLPLAASTLGITLFSGISGFGLVKLRRKLKFPKQKIEVEIER